MRAYEIIIEDAEKDEFVSRLRGDIYGKLLGLRDAALRANEWDSDEDVLDVIELAMSKIQNHSRFDWEDYSKTLNDKIVSLLDNDGKRVDFVSWTKLGMHSEYFDAEGIEDIAKNWKKVLDHK